ncbi:S24 family peptidase [Sulfobacillus harzensis]|uniref:Helix-turn-helix domain-containing protein n=1 Tax=Sulfobacillus harzensis TaxID=2729629 RepID=A0A7Y0L224_9FIRM|nr:helix-turn-helix domain-containing protein [Sulfobacillus harzensis]
MKTKENYFGRKLREARLKKGLTQEALAEVVGLTKSQISRYESGKSGATLDIVARLAEALDIGNFVKLLDPLPGLGPANDSAQHKMAAQLPEVLPVRPVPILGRIHAGVPWPAQPDRDGDVLIPPSLPADFALRVQGDSMVGAGIMPGDLVICRSTESRTPQHGDIVVALFQGEDATCKYLIRDGGRWKLRAANPRYPDRILAAPDDPVIQAVVVSIQSDPKNRKAPDLRELVQQSDLVDLQGLTPDQRRLVRQMVRQLKARGEGSDEIPDDLPFF